MENLYKVLQVPTKENLQRHQITYFDRIIDKYPSVYETIITYINECYNYKSPLIVEEKEWSSFLKERFEINELPDYLRDDILNYKSPEIVIAIDDYITHQKEPAFQTLIAKQNLRKDMLVVIQDPAGKVDDKQKANNLVTTLDEEINAIFERMRQDQKVFGNYKGFDAIKQAKAATQVVISQFIEDEN